MKEKPTNFETIEVVGSSLTEILTFYDGVNSKFPQFNPEYDFTRKWIIGLKRNIEWAKKGNHITSPDYAHIIYSENIVPEEALNPIVILKKNLMNREDSERRMSISSLIKKNDIFKKPALPQESVKTKEDSTQFSLF